MGLVPVAEQMNPYFTITGGPGRGDARQLLATGHQPAAPLESRLCPLEPGDLGQVIQPQGNLQLPLTKNGNNNGT